MRPLIVELLRGTSDTKMVVEKKKKTADYSVGHTKQSEMLLLLLLRLLLLLLLLM